MATKPSPRPAQQHTQATTTPASQPHATNPRKRPRQSMEDYETVVSATVDTEGRLDETIRRLMPTHFPTTSAAKKAVRRHEVLINGTRMDRTEYV